MTDDLISRQAAIKAFENEYPSVAWLDYAADVIKALPSAQPEWGEMLVICDNCGHAIHVKRQ